jgi:hypothetical protein
MFQRAGECAKLGYRELLGAGGRRYLGMRQQGFDRDTERFEARAQHFTALAERRRCDAL